jgi:xanthine dehydrogenase large subunit
MSKQHQDTLNVGRTLFHDSASKHVTGEAVYVDDYPTLVNQHFACIGGSSIAHGKIISINLDDVRKSEGVVDVIVAGDVPGRLDIGPVFPGDPLLVKDTVEYSGQPVFAVAATSHHLARQAAARAVIEYQELEAVLNLQQSIDQEFYVRPPHHMRRGDATKALAAAAHRLQSTMTVGAQEHFYLEGQASIAVPGEDGGMTIHTSTQNPTETQKLVAEVLNLPMNRVDVVTRQMGGGFGGKETHAAPWACIAAVFASRAGVATTCRLSRRDDMVMTGKRHIFQNRYDVGFDDTGRIEGISYQLAGQCGYSPDLSDAIVNRAMFHCDNAYYLPDVAVEGLRCKTHTVSNTAFRGFGGPQGLIAAEAMMDEIAYACGLDPLKIRKRNLYNTEERNVTQYHQTLEAFNIPKIINQLEAESDYQNRRNQIRQFNKNNQVLKKGLALTPVKFGISFTVSHLNQAGALIHLYTDGSIHLNHGGTEMDQGLMVKVVQIVAEAFQVKPERIIASATRTDKVPNTSPNAASSGTDINGMAALNAALTLK